jgi:BirA family biotin operon repressor/biotin-[acetyl-CoA-carboxylase] ligase
MTSPVYEHLDPDKIKTNTKHIGRKILVYNHTSSTNDVAAEYAKNKENDGLAIFAEEQTAGRGRTGNKWLSGRSDSVLCSILLTDCKCNPELLSLACPVAVAEAVGKIAHSHAKIKWPNDIILNGKKAAGIVVESKKVNGSTAYIIGIGINCHQNKTSFPQELQATATSIDIESGSMCDRISLAKRLLTSLDHWLEAAENDGGKIIDQWSKLNTLLNQRITVIYNGRKFTGNCIGVDPEKGLILQLDRGGVRFFDAAHTSIAK